MGVLDYGSSDYLGRLSKNSGPATSAGLEPTGFMDNFTASAENFRVNFKSNSEEELMNELINDQLNLIYQTQNPDIRFNPKVAAEGFAPKRDLTTKEKLLFAATPALMPLIGSQLARDKSAVELTNLASFGYEGKKKRFQELTHDILKLQEQYPDAGLQTWDQLMSQARNESQRLKEILSQVSNNRTWGGVSGMLTGVMKEALTDPYVLMSMMFGTSKITGGTKSFNAMKAFYTEFLIGAGSEVFIQSKVYDWSAELQNPWSLKDAAVTILTVGGFAGVTRAGGSYVVDVIEAGKAAKTLRAKGENVKADTLENYIDLYNGAPAARDVLEQDAQLKAIDDIQRAIDDGKSGPELQLEIERIAKETGIDLERLGARESEMPRTRDSEIPILSKKLEEEIILNANKNQGTKLGVSNGKGALQEQLLKTLNERLGSDGVERYVREVFEVAKTNLKNSSKSAKDKDRLTKALDEQLERELADVRERITKVDGKPEKVDGKPEVIKPKKVIYHGTNTKFDEFDLEKTSDGTVWFTSNREMLESGQYDGVGSSKYIVERTIDEDQLKLADWDMYDKHSTDELINMGYDGLKLVDKDETTYRIFDPTKLERVASTSPEIGKPVRLQDLDQSEIQAAELAFRQPQITKNLTPNQYHKQAAKNQKELDSLGKELGDEFGDKVLFLSPGIKDLQKVKDKIVRKSYDGTGQLTDVIRAGFAVKNYDDVLELITRISNKYDVLDEGFIMNGAGYYDHKLLVRFKDGQIGEIQLWEPHLLAAKEGRGYVNKLFTKDMKDYISDFDVPLRKDSGHNIYDAQKKLFDKNGKVKNQKKYDELNKKQDEVYSRASLSANTSWKSTLESILPDSNISKGSAGSQFPGSELRRITNPNTDPSEGVTTTAGRASQDTQSATSDSLNINSTSKPIITGATDRILLNDPQMARIMEEEFIAAKQIIDEAGDEFEVPFTVLDDLGNETTVIQSIKKVFNDIENDENALNSLNKCMGRAA
jgi:hypothetical protein